MSADGRIAGKGTYYAPDDYEDVNARYFAGILRDKSWRALPAGWHNPHSAAADTFDLLSPAHNDAVQYALDEGASLGDLKAAILSVLAAWEDSTVAWDEVTVCPSVSTANLVVLSALKMRGVRSVVFESPAYYATVTQADLLGFKVNRVACTLAQDFQAPCVDFASALPAAPCALWMTQPRFGIGTDQNLDRIRALAALLRAGDVIVFDEAAEQMFPSRLSSLGPVGCEVFRTRGLLKGLGLNGMRAAVILHPPAWRADLERVLEPAGASLDRFSLKNFATFAESPALLPALLTVANRQVVRLRQRLDTLTSGTWLRPTPLTNSYIGSMILDFRGLPGSYTTKRDSLLDYCRSRRMPVVLRASVGFPHDDTWEAVRINYFTSDENVETSAEILVEGFPTLLDHLCR